MKHQNRHTARLFRATREQLGISLRAMARQLKIPNSTVSRIECGLLTPKLAVVNRLVAISPANNLEELFVMAYR